MKLDLTVIKNDSVFKFEKAIAKVGDRFQEMLAIALDAAVHELDKDKVELVWQALEDLLRDEFAAYKNCFTRCMNKASELVENGLSS